MLKGNFVAHTVPITFATSSVTSVDVTLDFDGKLWGIEIRGLSWNNTSFVASAMSSARVTLYSKGGTVLLSSTPIGSAGTVYSPGPPATPAPSAHFFSGSSASANAIFISPGAYLRYNAQYSETGTNHADANLCNRCVSGGNAPREAYPSTFITLYCEI